MRVHAAGLDVAIDAVEADVELSAQVPIRVRRLPLEEPLEGLEPGHPLAALRLPELLEAALVDVGLGVGLGGEALGRRIAPLLEQERVDRVAGCLCPHGLPPSGGFTPKYPAARMASPTPIRPASKRCPSVASFLTAL